MTVKEIYSVIDEALKEHIKKVRKHMTKFYVVFENAFGVKVYTIAEEFEINENEDFYTIFNNQEKRTIPKQLYTFKRIICSRIFNQCVKRYEVKGVPEHYKMNFTGGEGDV